MARALSDAVSHALIDGAPIDGAPIASALNAVVDDAPHAVFVRGATLGIPCRHAVLALRCAARAARYSARVRSVRRWTAGAAHDVVL